MTVILMTDRGRRLAGRRYCRRCGRLSGIRARDHATAGAAGGHAHAHQARASASPDHWPCFTARALDHRPPQYTDEELIKLAARDGILIESWRVASPLRAVPRVICVHACASAPPGAPVTTVQQTSPQPARAPHLGVDRKASGFAPLRQDAKVWNQGPGEVRQAYDLVLNTAAMSVTAGVEQVTQIAHSPRHQPTAASQRIVAGLLQQAQDCD